MEQIINKKLNYYVAPHWILGLKTSNLISLHIVDYNMQLAWVTSAC